MGDTGVIEKAIALAEKLGLDPERFFEIAAQSSGQCWSLTTYCPVPGPVPTSPANNDYRPGFAGALAEAAIALANKLARIAWSILRHGTSFDAARDRDMVMEAV